MADEAKQLRATLLKLHVAKIVLRNEYRDKEDAIDGEVERLLQGGAGIGALLKRFQQHFDRYWGVRYAGGETGKYVWNFAKDVPQQKRLIAKLAIDELERRVMVYLMDADEYYVKARHPFGLFVTNVNRFAERAGEQSDAFALRAPTSGDCARDGKHQPPCKDDQEHTRRKMADIRGATV